MVICKELDCELRAFYNFENDEWKCLYCNVHKKEGMVYLKKRRICIDESCKKNPNFNFEDQKYPDYCNVHKKDGMVDIKNKKCAEETCIKRPFFNLPNKIGGLYCFDHKQDKMTNVCSKKCLKKDCEITPEFNYDGKKNGAYCSQHKLENMINVHATKCKNNCGIQLETMKYRHYCLRCFINLFPNEKISRNYKIKEIHMTDYLKEQFKDEVMVFDKQTGGCSKRRPDVYIDKFTHVVIIECDENQHRDTSCENMRIMELFQDFGNRPIVFIRFNPDSYINKKGENIPSSFKLCKKTGASIIRDKKEWIYRLDLLKEIINKHLITIPEKEVTYEYLFFNK